jgi:hypothetical protein
MRSPTVKCISLYLPGRLFPCLEKQENFTVHLRFDLRPSPVTTTGVSCGFPHTVQDSTRTVARNVAQKNPSTQRRPVLSPVSFHLDSLMVAHKPFSFTTHKATHTRTIQWNHFKPSNLYFNRKNVPPIYHILILHHCYNSNSISHMFQNLFYHIHEETSDEYKVQRHTFHYLLHTLLKHAF